METERSGKIRVLAVVSAERQPEIRRQILSFGMDPVLVSPGAHMAPLMRSDDCCQVVLLPAALHNAADWWTLWGELAMLRPRPVILVYAPSASFQLWSGVLEAGGYDVVVEPLTDDKLRDALLRAAESYDAPEEAL